MAKNKYMMAEGGAVARKKVKVGKRVDKLTKGDTKD